MKKTKTLLQEAFNRFDVSGDDDRIVFRGNYIATDDELYRAFSDIIFDIALDDDSAYSWTFEVLEALLSLNERERMTVLEQPETIAQLHCFQPDSVEIDDLLQWLAASVENMQAVMRVGIDKGYRFDELTMAIIATQVHHKEAIAIRVVSALSNIINK